MDTTGRCLCGAVSFSAKGLDPKVTACHCDMCRRWTGGPLLALGGAEIDWSGAEAITTFASSKWAERAFCSVCGSSLYYRVTAEGPFQGVTHLAFGTINDPSGFDLQLEYFIDRKPDAYEFAGEHQRLTEAEVFAKFTGGAD